MPSGEVTSSNPSTETSLVKKENKTTSEHIPRISTLRSGTFAGDSLECPSPYRRPIIILFRCNHSLMRQSKQLPFYKMNGIGNDFVLFDARTFDKHPPESEVQLLCDRKRGVGADGVILLEEGDEHPFRMVMYNPDGSRPEMCGNGIRCIARLIYDLGASDRTDFKIETDAGVKELQLRVDETSGDVEGVRVNMGAPGLTRSQVPMNGPDEPVRDEPIQIENQAFDITAVSTGNPHITIFVDDAEDVKLEEWGPQLEYHDAFPERTNVHFVEVLGDHELRQRTWERGAGVTEACGTGACGVSVSSIVTDRAASPITVHLDGGDLNISWSGNEDPIYMEGPAEYCFTGDWSIRDDSWRQDV